MAVRPFEINVPDTVLDDLRARLRNTRWPQPIDDAGWDYGANIDYVRELCAYWADGYDWRAHEARLNQLPGFLVEIDGVDIHFWHIRGKGPHSFPLLLIHGWPGSIAEFESIIPLLTDPAAHGGSAEDAFDLVVPALPGFGFGGQPRDRGWSVSRIGAAFDQGTGLFQVRRPGRRLGRYHCGEDGLGARIEHCRYPPQLRPRRATST